MAHAYAARLQPTAKPLRVIGGNIRTTARAENHIFFLAAFPGSPQRASFPYTYGIVQTGIVAPENTLGRVVN